MLVVVFIYDFFKKKLIGALLFWSLSNDDCDGNENCKKAAGLD